MRYDPAESYELWLDRIRQYEYNYSLLQIAKGVDVDVELENMSRRITEKMLYPVYEQIKKDAIKDYDNAQSIAEYKAAYLDKVTIPPSDHVAD